MDKKNTYLLCTRSGKLSIKNIETNSLLINKITFLSIMLSIIINYAFSCLIIYYVNNFTNHKNYQFVLDFLKISSTDFNNLLTTQFNYAITTIALSGLLAYVIPHILAAIVFIQLKSFSNENILYEDIMKLTKLSLIFFYYLVIPLIGSYICFYVIAKTMFYLTKHYAANINNFFRVLIIIFSLYTTFFIINLTVYAINEHLWFFIKS